jgi:pyridoxine 5-phosphate synthase
MIHLAVNIDHIATLREARGGVEPDPVSAATIAELAGAVGIVCHLREDRRHVNDRDVRLLRETVKTKLDLEMAPTPEIIGIAIKTLPDLVTFVPEHREELTTEGGLDIAKNLTHYADITAKMHQHDIEVSFFIEPLKEQINAASTVGAEIIELHTGTFANALTAKEQQNELAKLREASAYADSLGLRVTCGHGLNYTNVHHICTIPEMQEISIGHAIISRAAFVGLDTAVRTMIRLLESHSA